MTKYRLSVQKIEDGEVKESTSYEGQFFVATVFQSYDPGTRQVNTNVIGEGMFDFHFVPAYGKSCVDVLKTICKGRLIPSVFKNFMDGILSKVEDDHQEFMKRHRDNLKALADACGIDDKAFVAHMDKLKALLKIAPDLSEEEFIKRENALSDEFSELCFRSLMGIK
jgi:hypothetical protein